MLCCFEPMLLSSLVSLVHCHSSPASFACCLCWFQHRFVLLPAVIRLVVVRERQLISLNAVYPTGSFTAAALPSHVCHICMHECGCYSKHPELQALAALESTAALCDKLFAITKFPALGPDKEMIARVAEFLVPTTPVLLLASPCFIVIVTIGAS